MATYFVNFSQIYTCCNSTVNPNPVALNSVKLRERAENHLLIPDLGGKKKKQPNKNPQTNQERRSIPVSN